MSIWSRVKSRFSKKPAAPDVNPMTIVTEVIDEIGEDDLEEIWLDIAEDIGATTNVEYAEQFKDFALDNNVMELFISGWVDMDGTDSDTLTAIREEFFDIMSEYDISEDNFDWDAWRDWYTD